MLWHCDNCTTAYSPGAPGCPHCGEKAHHDAHECAGQPGGKCAPPKATAKAAPSP